MNATAAESGDRATRTVLLRHELPDGTWHFDWMIERATDVQRRLLTFRIRWRVDLAAMGTFGGERAGDHLAAYLDFEGPVSGGRGRVARVAAGRVLRLREGEGEAEIWVDFGGGVVRWAARRDAASADSGIWVFSRMPG